VQEQNFMKSRSESFLKYYLSPVAWLRIELSVA
jgi:hypothetical protein